MLKLIINRCAKELYMPRLVYLKPNFDSSSLKCWCTCANTMSTLAVTMYDWPSCPCTLFFPLSELCTAIDKSCYVAPNSLYLCMMNRNIGRYNILFMTDDCVIFFIAVNFILIISG